MSRVAKKAAKHFAKVALLQSKKGEEGVAARKELKRMRDVHYDTDPFYPSAGAAWNPKGKKVARGSSAKCDRINSAHRAKKGPRV